MIINPTARALLCVEIIIGIGVVRSDAVACGVSLMDAGAKLTLDTSDVRFGSKAKVDVSCMKQEPWSASCPAAMWMRINLGN